MSKEIKSLYCPQCKKQKKFENSPQGYSGFMIFTLIILAICLFFIPLLGWLGSIVCILAIFTDKKDQNKFYCSECGYTIEINKKNKQSYFVK